MVDTIFATDLGQIALLFLLVFTVVFAILQKSKLLGDGKRQIDALVALAIGLIVIGADQVLHFAQKLIPFMAILMIIILVFMLLLAMFFKDEIKMSDGIRTAFGILIFIIVIVAVLIFSGGWEWIINWVSSSNAINNIILIVIIVVAIIVAYFGAGKKSESK
jgi:hypothetical protein